MFSMDDYRREPRLIFLMVAVVLGSAAVSDGLGHPIVDLSPSAWAAIGGVIVLVGCGMASLAILRWLTPVPAVPTRDDQLRALAERHKSRRAG